ncbi:MAG: hypothetical protein OZ921_04520 [Sorangiineae bacterium]|nr:hypothetical protein [Polyangiaceae bacterium]MEB2321755.1 hypothetical protein [Sorangiineae bacterium]
MTTKPCPVRLAATLALLGALPLSGCDRSEAPASGRASSATPSASVAPAPARAAERFVGHAPPSGPLLPIQAGKGVGPIFLGATIPTIERHMQLPCELESADQCRYIGRGVDFFLKDGALERVHVQRMDRPAGKDAAGRERHYGIFHGAIPPDLKLGMLPWAIHEHLGEPKRVERLTEKNPNGTVYVEHYEGMELEFDELGPGRVVLGGVWIPARPAR